MVSPNVRILLFRQNPNIIDRHILKVNTKDLKFAKRRKTIITTETIHPPRNQPFPSKIIRIK